MGRPIHLWESVHGWAQARPDDPALRCGDDVLTYAALDTRVERFAGQLAEIGIGTGDLVAISLPLGPDAVVWALAALRAGAAYLPLDPDAPARWQEAVLRDAAVAGLVTGAGALAGPRGCRLIEPSPPADEDEPEPADPVELDPTDLAYVIYTSGSSGTPKGVMVTHGNLDFYLRRADAHYPSGGDGSVLHSPLAFDLSVTSLFLTLVRGETVTIVPPGPGVEGLVATLARGRTGILKVTPSHLRLLNASVPDGALAERVTSLVLGGEALYHQDLRRWRAESPGTRIFNEYGPTETTVGVLVHEVGDGGDGPVPIGVPFDGVEVRVADERPDGTGELVVLGPSVARGYLGRSGDGPFGCVPDRADSYRTGDLVECSADGQYVYRGRADDQIKVAGRRVEPGEIEHALRGHPAIGDVAVVLGHGSDTAPRLTAYLVADGVAPSTGELRDFLTDRLPAALVPTGFEFRAELPHTLNGKVDRAALVAGAPAPVDEADDGTAVAVVGIDCVFPGAAGPDAFWELVRSGADGLTALTDDQLATAGVPRETFDRSGYVRVAGVIDDIDLFDAEFFGITAAEAQLMDPQHRLLLHSVWRALEHAGHCAEADRHRTGLFAGVSANTYLYTQIIPHWDTVGTAGTELQVLMAGEKDFAPARAAYEMDLHGPAVAVQTGCSTGLVGVHLAARSLLSGECDLAVAAAACVRVPHHAGTEYREGSIVSPTGQCRAFDADADGCVQGNGVASVVLRRLADAVRDGDTIYAVVAGSAVNNDGRRKVGYAAPSVDGQRDVIRTAHLVAGVAPEQIGYVEAHGTATALGDPVEAEALRQAFGDVGCAVGSVKTNIGHLDTAAGLAGLIKTTLAVHHGVLPPSRNFDRLNPAISWPDGTFTVQRELAPWPADRPRVAGVSAFSVGGTNAHAVLRAGPVRPSDGPGTGSTHCVVLSARRAADLSLLAGELADHVERNPGIDLGDLAFTLQYGRAEWPHRMAVVAGDAAELCRLLRTPAAEPGHADAVAWVAGGTVDWSSWHRGRRPRRLALPGTVFRPIRHWVAPVTRTPRATPAPVVATPAATDETIYAPQWRLEPAWPAASGAEAVRGWLVFADDTPLAEALLARLARREEPLLVVRPGTGFARSGERTWTVGAEPEDYEKLLAAVAELQVEPNRIVHAWQTGTPVGDGLDLAAFDAGIARGLTSLTNLGQAIARRPAAQRQHLAIVTEHQFAFGASGPVDPARAASLGPALVFPQEINGVTTALRDVAGLPADRAAALLEAELVAANPGVYAHRGTTRYRRELAPIGVADDAPRATVRGETWLVTGGFGGVGFELAKELAVGGADLVLVDRPAADDAPRPAPVRPDPAEHAHWLAEELAARTRAARIPLIHDDPELVDRLTQMSAASVLAYLRRIGVDTAAGEPVTADAVVRAGGIRPDFAPMADFMVLCLEQAGAVEDGSFTGQGVPSAEAARLDVVEWAPDLGELMDFVGTCVDSWPEVLSGKRDAVAVLYPQGSEDRMEAAARVTMRHSIGSVQADLLADWIGRLAARGSAGRPVRLLEVGAGNGLLTDKVVDVLARAGVPVEYWISDIGRTFAAKARQNYGGRLPGIHAVALDISRDPAEQGFLERDFDLVFGLNVVHATRDVRESFAQLRTVLAPAGQVALLESVKFEPWVDLVAGLAPGWWAFDDAYRTTSPLLDADRWCDAMTDAGLVDPFALPADGPDLDRADCAIIVGREPGEARPVTPGSAKRDKVRALTDLGARVTVVTADVADPAAVRTALAAERGPVHGVVHCAAEVRGGMVATLPAADRAAELDAKTRGAIAVLAALRADPVHTVMLSSSLNVHFGGEGQTGYVAANAALAGVCDALRDHPARVVAVDWDRWDGVGLAAQFQRSFAAVRGRDVGAGMTVAHGISAFHAAIASGLPQVAVSMEPFADKYAGYLSAHRPASASPAPPQVEAVEEVLCAGLVAACREMLGDEQFGAADRLVDFGADSIFVLQLQAEIEDRFGVRLFTAALMGETVANLARACVTPAEHQETVLVLDAALLERATREGGAG
ncbi:MAG TPA: amino acid adenylation domain-containing protein [Actinocatenispora sp.]